MRGRRRKNEYNKRKEKGGRGEKTKLRMAKETKVEKLEKRKIISRRGKGDE